MCLKFPPLNCGGEEISPLVPLVNQQSSEVTDFNQRYLYLLAKKIRNRGKNFHRLFFLHEIFSGDGLVKFSTESNGRQPRGSEEKEQNYFISK